MTDHVHVSALDAFKFALYLLVVGFFFRMVEVTWPDSAVGKALAFIH